MPVTRVTGPCELFPKKEEKRKEIYIKENSSNKNPGCTSKGNPMPPWPSISSRRARTRARRRAQRRVRTRARTRNHLRNLAASALQAGTHTLSVHLHWSKPTFPRPRASWPSWRSCSWGSSTSPGCRRRSRPCERRPYSPGVGGRERRGSWQEVSWVIYGRFRVTVALGAPFEKEHPEIYGTFHTQVARRGTHIPRGTCDVPRHVCVKCAIYSRMFLCKWRATCHLGVKAA